MTKIKLKLLILSILFITFNFIFSGFVLGYDPEEIVTFDKSVGACGFIDDPVEGVLSALGTIREYHNYRWVTEKFGECRFTQGTWWNWDSYYKALYDLNIDPVPCLQGTSQADRTGYNSSKQQKPINPGEDSEDPFSYSEHAQTITQYVMRYGNKKVDDQKLLLQSDQTRVSGLGYIRYYENSNEPDKSWEGEESHFSGRELAAMCSADYDGHEGKMGDMYGVKTIDKDAKLVMGGIAGGRYIVDYLEEMQAWADENRQDKRLPIDVINFHMYSGKLCPEKYEYIEDFKKIKSWRDEHYPDMEIWMTEFGWDTNINSPHGTSFENQRDWMIRTYLIANAHGIDRSTMYMSRDVGNQSDSGKYGTSGLTTKKGEQAKKTSWYGVKTLKNTLNGFLFDSIIEENENMFIYKFINNNTSEICYVLWSPTDDGTKINDFKFNVGKNKEVTVTSFVDNSETGSIKPCIVDSEDNIMLEVSESPIYVKVKEVLPKEFLLEMKLEKEEKDLFPGDAFKVTLNIDKLNLVDDKGLYALSGILEYDKEILELNLDSLKGLNSWEFSKEDLNELNSKFVTVARKAVMENSEVLELEFKVKEKLDSEKDTLISIKNIEAGTGYGLYQANDVNINVNILKKQEPEKEDKITSDIYKIQYKYIYRISPNTKVKDFLENVNTENELVFTDLDGKILSEEDLIKTGTQLKVGKTLKYNLVVTGDVDSNGIITINDLVKVKLHIIKKELLTGINLFAAELIDDDERITVNDIAIIKLYLINNN